MRRTFRACPLTHRPTALFGRAPHTGWLEHQLAAARWLLNASRAQSEAGEPTRRAAEQWLSRLASEELSRQCQARLTACEGAAERCTGLSASEEEPIHASGWLRRAWPTQTIEHGASATPTIGPAAAGPEWFGSRRYELRAL